MPIYLYVLQQNMLAPITATNTKACSPFFCKPLETLVPVTMSTMKIIGPEKMLPCISLPFPDRRALFSM